MALLSMLELTLLISFPGFPTVSVGGKAWERGYHFVSLDSTFDPASKKLARPVDYNLGLRSHFCALNHIVSINLNLL